MKYERVCTEKNAQHANDDEPVIGDTDDDSDSDEEEEEGSKVLKSAKDKRFDELEGTIRSIENAEKINDWAVISDRTSSTTQHGPWRGMGRTMLTRDTQSSTS